jgi:hypothetical protein
VNPASAVGRNGLRNTLSGAVSYVTGSHNLKTGIQYTNGFYRAYNDANADLVQQYQNGVPVSVRVYNTPLEYRDTVNIDLGIYAQEAWTLKRMTLNAGLRYDHFNSQLNAVGVPPGRFTQFPRELPALKNVPNWNDVSPRIGVAYDLFGNAKTAIKANFAKYLETWGTGFAEMFNPLTLKSENRSWADCDYLAGTSTCSGRALATTGDNIAQDNEIGPGTANFGIVSVLPRVMDPNVNRSYNLETSVGVQHQLLPGLALNGMWYHRGVYNLTRTDNKSILLTDYTPLDIFNPLDGSTITIYNLLPAKLTAPTSEVVTNSTDSSKRRVTYNGFEVSFNGRLPRGGTAFGGWTTDRTLTVKCDSQTDPNSLRFCDQSQLAIPYVSEYKLAVAEPLWFGISASATVQSYSGIPLAVNWTLTKTTRYPADCPSPCTPNALVVPTLTQASLIVNTVNGINLIAPGEKYSDRFNQLNLGLRKSFRFTSDGRLSVNVQVFNALNGSAVVAQNQVFGSTLDRPTATIQPRAYSVGAQLDF